MQQKVTEPPESKPQFYNLKKFKIKIIQGPQIYPGCLAQSAGDITSNGKTAIVDPPGETKTAKG